MHDILSISRTVIKDVVIASTTAYVTEANNIDMSKTRQVVARFRVTDGGTGNVVTLKQGTTAASCNTALPFTRYQYCADIVAAPNTVVLGTASSNTFTTGTASKAQWYQIPITDDMLTEGYKFVRVNVATAASTTLGELSYTCYDLPINDSADTAHTL